MADHDSLEMATDRIGRQLSSPSLAGALVERRLMARMMSHPSSRLQAFRFVDVLPTLSIRDAIAGHLGPDYVSQFVVPVHEHTLRQGFAVDALGRTEA